MCSGQKPVEWTNEQDEILIDFVRSHECLYNIQCKDYRKAQLKQSLWNEIAQILHMTDSDCYKRWGYVRDYYIRRRGKPGTGSSGEAAKKRSEQLSLLDSISSVKRSTLSDIGQYESQRNREFNTADFHKHSSSMEHEQSELLTEDETTHDHSYTQKTEVDLLKTPKTKRKCTAKSTTADERLKMLKQIAKRQDQIKIEKEKEEDENDLFFGSMTKIIKHLPKAVQARLRMQVGNLVGNAEIEHLSNLSTKSFQYRPSSAASSTTSTSNITFVTEDYVTPIGPPSSIVTAEPNSQRYFMNLE